MASNADWLSRNDRANVRTAFKRRFNNSV